MAVLSTLRRLCCGRADPEPSNSEKSQLSSTEYVPYRDKTKPEVAKDITAKLFSAEKNDAALQADLQSAIHAYGWYDGLAVAILTALEQAFKVGKDKGPAIKTAYEKAVSALHEVKEWAEEHPEMTAVIITLIALGVLALMMPWLMAYLGFAEEGIVEASWAARWQATYRGFVPKSSLFSYLQSLGTKIGRNWQG
ncbi:MAG: hypothetical protein M1820_001200 [Bogoriella megaspora]|nr:MAG: hypothetical protein M1820_001200 [Bogoriella megaspora]